MFWFLPHRCVLKLKLECKLGWMIARRCYYKLHPYSRERFQGLSKQPLNVNASNRLDIWQNWNLFSLENIGTTIVSTTPQVYEPVHSTRHASPSRPTLCLATVRSATSRLPRRNYLKLIHSPQRRLFKGLLKHSHRWRLQSCKQVSFILTQSVRTCEGCGAQKRNRFNQLLLRFWFLFFLRTIGYTHGVWFSSDNLFSWRRNASKSDWVLYHLCYPLTVSWT